MGQRLARTRLEILVLQCVFELALEISGWDHRVAIVAEFLFGSKGLRF